VRIASGPRRGEGATSRSQADSLLYRAARRKPKRKSCGKRVAAAVLIAQRPRKRGGGPSSLRSAVPSPAPLGVRGDQQRGQAGQLACQSRLCRISLTEDEHVDLRSRGRDAFLRARCRYENRRSTRPGYDTRVAARDKDRLGRLEEVPRKVVFGTRFMACAGRDDKVFSRVHDRDRAARVPRSHGRMDMNSHCGKISSRVSPALIATERAEEVDLSSEFGEHRCDGNGAPSRTRRGVVGSEQAGLGTRQQPHREDVDPLDVPNDGYTPHFSASGVPQPALTMLRRWSSVSACPTSLVPE
jgi:hypothetical protein